MIFHACFFSVSYYLNHSIFQGDEEKKPNNILFIADFFIALHCDQNL